ncbi:MAG: VWA domain-containing protein [Opitutae bacterium]|nr:VWA domain-containing protein [Opitutae bacterium]MBC9888988.1 VWA domain-containing protein [Opitutae bacterium]
MKRKRRGAFATFSLSFLDCISCGFGAIILLFVIFRGSHPQILEQVESELEGLLKDRENAIFEIRGDILKTNLNLDRALEQLSELEDRIAQLQRLFSEVKGQYAASDARARKQADEEESLEKALQELDLSRMPEQKRTEVVGGIPADSEYVIFVIDTSGSMNQFERLVAKKLEETLFAFPNLKGIQIMDADGVYLFSGTEGAWLSDSPSERRRILDRYLNWNKYSGSNPGPGILTAITDFNDGEEKISIFVFGDEMDSGNPTEFLSIVERNNPKLNSGDHLIRIHGIGFHTVSGPTGKNFAELMRILAVRNGGAFVGITDR